MINKFFNATPPNLFLVESRLRRLRLRTGLCRLPPIVQAPLAQRCTDCPKVVDDLRHHQSSALSTFNVRYCSRVPQATMGLTPRHSVTAFAAIAPLGYVCECAIAFPLRGNDLPQRPQCPNTRQRGLAWPRRNLERRTHRTRSVLTVILPNSPREKSGSHVSKLP